MKWFDEYAEAILYTLMVLALVIMQRFDYALMVFLIAMISVMYRIYTEIKEINAVMKKKASIRIVLGKDEKEKMKDV